MKAMMKNMEKTNPVTTHKTPPAKRRAPSPSDSVPSSKSKGSDGSNLSRGGINNGSGPPTTQAAKEQRLRRVCEEKPSGRCHVTAEVHDMWKKGGVSRAKLLDQFESASWDKDGVHRLGVQSFVVLIPAYNNCMCVPSQYSMHHTNHIFQETFLNQIKKSITNKKKTQKMKKRGWYTKDGMKSKLQWSKFFCCTKLLNIVMSC